MAQGSVPTTPPGWYDDGTGTQTLRWWNGTAWTENTAPIQDPATPPVHTTATAATAEAAMEAPATAGSVTEPETRTVLEPQPRAGSFHDLAAQMRANQADFHEKNVASNEMLSEKWQASKDEQAERKAADLARRETDREARESRVTAAAQQKAAVVAVREQQRVEAATAAAQKKAEAAATAAQRKAEMAAAAAERKTDHAAKMAQLRADYEATKAARRAPKNPTGDATVLNPLPTRAVEKADKARAKQVAAHNKAVAKQHVEWSEQVTLLSAAVHVAETAGPISGAATVLLKPGEQQWYVTAGSLIDEVAGQKTWVSGSQGMSIPIGKIGGRSIRYYAGRSKGHSVQAPAHDAVVDTGTIVITSTRVVFLGKKQTKEFLFAKLVSFQHDAVGQTTFAVSNRQKPTRLQYPDSNAFQITLELAVSGSQGESSDVADRLRTQLQQLRAAEPKVITA